MRFIPLPPFVQRVLEGMRVHESAVLESVRKSDAFLERALMLLTKRGHSRQEAHEQIRKIALSGVRGGDELLNALPTEVSGGGRRMVF